MRNLSIFIVLCSILTLSIFIGKKKYDLYKEQEWGGINAAFRKVPHIGKIEVLNGCGIKGAAAEMADFLRDKRFDVKRIDNAETWNYPFTIIVSRTNDMTTAKKICEVFDTDKLIVLRNGSDLYDVTVFIGSDYEELIKDE